MDWKIVGEDFPEQSGNIILLHYSGFEIRVSHTSNIKTEKRANETRYNRGYPLWLEVPDVPNSDFLKELVKEKEVST